MNETGHMLVARIAWNHMVPAAQKALTAILADPHNPEMQQDTTAINGDQANEAEVNYGAACFMDDGKFEARKNKKPGCPCNDEAGLHFDNLPIGDPNYFPKTPNTAANAISTLNAKLGILQDRVPATADQKAEGARDIMHLVGDMHQPLHCVDRFSAEFPKGDMGGNAVLVNWLPGIQKYPSELHGLMDDGGARPNAAGTANENVWGEIKRPLLDNPDSQKKLADMAGLIESHYPSSKFTTTQLNDLAPADWSQEGKKLAEEVVYPGLDAALAKSPDHKTLGVGDPYLTQMADLMEKQTALAGYRLANVFNTIFTGGQPWSLPPGVDGPAA